MRLPSKAFVFAAGFGTRLRPYTLSTPKPMLDVLGRPLVEHILCYLACIGVRDVTVNTAWLPEAFDPLPGRAADLGLRLSLSRQPKPFQHGGDLAFARPFLESLDPGEAFLAINGDTVFWLPPALIEEAASHVSAEAPLLILGFQTESNPLTVRESRLVGIRDHRYLNEEPTHRLDDFGVRLMHASIRDHLAEPGEELSFYGPDGLVARVIGAGCTVWALPVADHERKEIGSVEDYETHTDDEVLRSLAAQLCG